MNTSYTDILDISVQERIYIAECIKEKHDAQKKAIEEQEKVNESIAMTIDELASLTKIQQVAAEQGLSYNNNNIKTVTED